MFEDDEQPLEFGRQLHDGSEDEKDAPLGLAIEQGLLQHLHQFPATQVAVQVVAYQHAG